MDMIDMPSPSPSRIQPMRLLTRRTINTPRVAYTIAATKPRGAGAASAGFRSLQATAVSAAPAPVISAVEAHSTEAARERVLSALANIAVHHHRSTVPL